MTQELFDKIMKLLESHDIEMKTLGVVLFIINKGTRNEINEMSSIHNNRDHNSEKWQIYYTENSFQEAIRATKEVYKIE